MYKHNTNRVFMNEQVTMQRIQLSFKEFLMNNRRQRIILLFSTIAIIIQFIIFKYFYPYPSFTHGDSFLYLKGAYENLGINTYMIGYSSFLRLFSVFSNSDTILVGF